MVRRVVFALGMAILPLAAQAAPTAPPAPEARNGGTIQGRVTDVDYQRSTMGVDAGHGRIDISVMPSTSIQAGDSAYHTFSDVKPGQRVQVLSSIAGGRYVAQIIRIR